METPSNQKRSKALFLAHGRSRMPIIEQLANTLSNNNVDLEIRHPVRVTDATDKKPAHFNKDLFWQLLGIHPVTDINDSFLAAESYGIDPLEKRFDFIFADNLAVLPLAVFLCVQYECQLFAVDMDGDLLSLHGTFLERVEKGRVLSQCIQNVDGILSTSPLTFKFEHELFGQLPPLYMLNQISITKDQTALMRAATRKKLKIDPSQIVLALNVYTSETFLDSCRELIYAIDFIKAIPNLRSSSTSLLLMLSSKLNYRELLIQAEELGFDKNRIHIEFYADESEKHHLLASSDVVIIPAAYADIRMFHEVLALEIVPLVQNGSRLAKLVADEGCGICHSWGNPQEAILALDVVYGAYLSKLKKNLKKIEARFGEIHAGDILDFISFCGVTTNSIPKSMLRKNLRDASSFLRNNNAYDSMRSLELITNKIQAGL